MTWTVDGVEREAVVFAPTAESPRGRHPLILAFHGHGGNMTGTSRWGLQNRWPQAIVVYPQGLDTPSGLDPKGRKPGWQRLAGDQGNRDLKFTDAMLATLRQKFKVDDRRVFATGFSNGAFFTLLLWIERRDTFAAFAVVAGALDPSQHLNTAKPVLHIGGESDPKVTRRNSSRPSRPNARSTARWARASPAAPAACATWAARPRCARSSIRAATSIRRRRPN